MGGNAGGRANPTALRTGGGRRLAGVNTVFGGRGVAAGRIASAIDAGRRLARQRARRVAGR